jgi:mannitol/fructose-specific phosphotransferase system IIA component (Ntr-type)
VAVPHGQVDGLGELLVGASTHPGGIRYPSLDGEPVRLVFCILGTPETAADHLACLARVARVARRADSLEPVVTASSAEEFLERLEALERGV